MMNLRTQMMIMASSMATLAALPLMTISPHHFGFRPTRRGRGGRRGPVRVRHTIGRTQSGESARRLRQEKYRKVRNTARKKGMSRNDAIALARPHLSA